MDRDQFQNNFNPEPRLPLENGSFAFPMDSVVVNGVNPLPYFNVSLRSNDHPSSSTEIPHYRSTTSASSSLHQQHISTGSSSSFVPSAYPQQGPCYNHYMIPGDEVRNLNPQVESGRSSIKRKSPSMPTYGDAGNTNWYYNSGSSSDITVCADRGQQKPWLSSHQWYWDQNGSVHNFNSNSLLISGEGPQRNVRSRHIHTPHVDASSSGTHFSSNLPCHFPQVGPGPDVNGHWSHNPVPNVSYGRTPPGASGFCHNNQSFINNSTSLSVESNGSHHNNIIASRHLGAPLPVIPGPSQSMSEGHGNSCQRVGSSHRSMTCYPNLLFTTTSQEVGQSGSGAFSRHSRPLSINGGRAERNGRPRFSYGRYQPYSNESSSHGRWTSEGVLMMDQSTFYDSSNLHDQHREMRLDVDSMSYEELLALEERIGNVNTGVSEDMMPKCLTRTIYCSSEQMQDLDEGSCVICLESYKDKDELGILKCGHDYHADCIKKWLLMKNVCPICKASALEDRAKG
ncbi:hypothetical protein Taro_014234 [Colocasia esculenta]|uniref:RING-type E3 ubiquitin transferase n=1 Tax=Colocasia esculenta TaxID=4460 RepID=A0A843UIU0_COLES|nr:hypothetical protein [Colocasia esculenta]